MRDVWCSGTQMLEKREHVVKITTGSASLDLLLGGGVESASITGHRNRTQRQCGRTAAPSPRRPAPLRLSPLPHGCRSPPLPLCRGVRRVPHGQVRLPHTPAERVVHLVSATPPSLASSLVPRALGGCAGLSTRAAVCCRCYAAASAMTETNRCGLCSLPPGSPTRCASPLRSQLRRAARLCCCAIEAGATLPRASGHSTRTDDSVVRV